MRRTGLILTTVFLVPAALVRADDIAATGRLTAVTLYPQGATLTREVTFDAPVGNHTLLLTDLPAETDAQGLRVVGEEGVKTGAIWLRGDRMVPRDPVLTPAQRDAKARLVTAQENLDAALDAMAAVQAQIEAADAEVAFLAGSRPDGAALDPESLKALSATVAQGVLAARQRAIAAGAALRPLDLAVTEATRLRDAAQAAYDSLPGADTDYAAVGVALSVATPGPHRLTLTQFLYDAGWSPVYDLTLRRAEPAGLTLARGALVTQYSGEDWVGVDLTLSTARPSERTTASELWPDYREIYDPQAESDMQAKAADGAVMDEPMMVAEAAPTTTAMPEVQGDILVYHYPAPADVGSGVDNLRLALDEIALEPRVQALAVPRADAVAYVTATFTNTSGEVLLPGPVYLYRDQTLIGGAEFPQLAAGDETHLGFGAIDGVILERQMPERSEGDRGILSGETEQSETATLTVKNLTSESWPVRLIDQIPYSEQDDLEITFAANPEPTEQDVDGQRGILAWEFDLPAGAERSVQIEHSLRWPSGMALR